MISNYTTTESKIFIDVTHTIESLTLCLDEDDIPTREYRWMAMPNVTHHVIGIRNNVEKF